MTTNLPTISVTEEKDSSPDSTSSDNEDSYAMDYNSNYGGVTDVEDFDSQGENSRSRGPSPHSLNVPKKKSQENDATDVEDYNVDSDSEDERSKVYPELKLSLQEFLMQGIQQQAMENNEGAEKIEMKSGNFLQAQNLNALPDYLTDCEDYNTDSDLEYEAEKSVCIDLDAALGGDQGKVCIADLARPLKDGFNEDSDQYEDVSVISDISDLASALSDVTGAGIRGMSEDEMMEMSGNEEECHIAYSGSSSDGEQLSRAESFSEANLFEVDVAFVGPSGHANKNAFNVGASCSKFSSFSGKSGSCYGGSYLKIEKPTEEVLTDVEKLEDSAAEEEGSFDNEEENQPIPRAIILAAGDDGACHTDVEDMLYDDGFFPSSSNSSEIPTVALENLPPPHREVVELKEDKFGDTITNVMPMDNEYQFGIHVSRDEGPTDTEDYSCAEDFDKSCSMAEVDTLASNNLIESEVTVENETLKHMQSKRLELHTNAESVTDVEEIYVAGTNRRKKNKTKTACKGAKPKFLDVNKADIDDGHTDVEDIDLSDTGIPMQTNKRSPDTKRPLSNPNLSADKVTDVEDMTADSVSDYDENETPQICGESLKHYTSNSANIVITLETDAKKKCPKHHHRTRTSLRNQMMKDEALNQPPTDVEDVQLPSDSEDFKDDNDSLPDTCCNCSELNDMLNESYTVVHEKSVRNFDVDRIHFKGPDLRDAHTDIEYVESDEPAPRDDN